MSSFVLKGDFAYCESPRKLSTLKNGVLVCENGISRGVFPECPEQYRGLTVHEYPGQLIVPGMVDLHIHAPQYAFRGIHMDEELLDWLKKYTFIEEARFSDLEYARRAYSIFAGEMKRSATTRAVMFATMHREATVVLMEEMEKTGLVSFVGKVNMDREAPENLLDPSADMSAYQTIGWINETQNRFRHTFPILTPRFIPSCSNQLLGELREIVHTYDIPIQSHLSENPGEVAWVKELMPDSEFYGDGYARFDLFGKNARTVMAHCIYSPEKEQELMKENGVFVAHCPSSNMNLTSGIAPIRKYMDMGLHVGLGSDVAGGEDESIFGEMRAAITVSKLYYRYVDEACRPLTFPEAFWLATAGGGEFFGRVGSFKEGYEVDAVVIDDEKNPHPQALSVEERLERSVYLGADRNLLTAKYAAGERVF